jgi:2-dehydro-3-deoxyphosphogalactonate aldolase
MTPNATLSTAMAACPLVAILRGLTVADTLPVADAVYRAGFRIIEVPLNSPSPLRSIELIAQLHPHALVGAGTVLSVTQVHAVKDAGGQLIVSPNFNAAVVRAAVNAGMVCLPGVLTPSEAFAALDAGAHGLKIFPAEMCSPAAIKALRAVLPAHTLLLPVGGITPHNMRDYRAAGASGFGIGSALYKPGNSAAQVAQNAIDFIASHARI